MDTYSPETHIITIPPGLSEPLVIGA